MTPVANVTEAIAMLIIVYTCVEQTRLTQGNLTRLTQCNLNFTSVWPGLEVIKLEFILRLKIKRNEWLLADTAVIFESFLTYIVKFRSGWAPSRSL